MNLIPTTARPRETKAAWPKPADMAVGWLGAALLYPLEILSLRPSSVGLVATSLALFATLGTLVGVSVAAGQAAAARVVSPWWRACLRSAFSLLVTIPVGLRLFDGAKA